VGLAVFLLVFRLPQVIQGFGHYRVGLAQLIRFLVVELTHLGLNTRFDIRVIFTANYSFSGRRRPHRQRDALGDRLCESQDQVDSVCQMCS
jgi:hypothetical protein